MASDRSLLESEIAAAFYLQVLNALWHLIGRYTEDLQQIMQMFFVLNALWHLIGRYLRDARQEILPAGVCSTPYGI